MTPSPGLRGAQAREAILRTAGEQFLRSGFRRTSIEAIARQAGVSRPTVYAHFESKEEIFRTIVANLHEAQLEAMRLAVESEGRVSDRLYAALAARFVPFVELTASSPYGAELLDENNRVCGDINRDAHGRSVALLENLLAGADEAGEISLHDSDVDAASAASIVYDAARGAKEDGAVTPQAYREQLRRLIGVLSRGLGAREPIVRAGDPRGRRSSAPLPDGRARCWS